MQRFEGMGPHKILQIIPESFIFALDTNGFTFQFGYNSVLHNIYGYYHKNINTVEDSLLLVYIKSIEIQDREINVNKFPENIRSCLIYHLFDLTEEGQCKIIHNQNKSIITRIVSFNSLGRNNSSGRAIYIADQNTIYRDVLEIGNRK
jgi:hypothetical protein